MSRRTGYFAKQKGKDIQTTINLILARQNAKCTKSSLPMKESTATRIATAMHRKGAN